MVDKKEVLEQMLHAMIEGGYSVDDAQTDAEDWLQTKIVVKRGDLIYLRLRLQDYIRDHYQYYDRGDLVTDDLAEPLTNLCDEITRRLT